MFRAAAIFVVIMTLCASARAQTVVLPDYPADPADVDTLGHAVLGYSIIPFVFHAGLTYGLDDVSGIGMTANLGQNVIQLVGSDVDSLGQGFWYQLLFRKNRLAPGSLDSLYQNFPNPFNPLTYVPFSISSELHQNRFVHVKIALVSTSGVETRVLVEGDYAYGYYAKLFDASDLSSGEYVYQMTIDDNGTHTPTHYVFSRKMTLLR